MNRPAGLMLGALALVACREPADDAPAEGVHDVAGGCRSVAATDAIGGDRRWLVPAAAGDTFELSTDADAAARFFLKPADLATYLLYDADGRYLVAEDGVLRREAALLSDVVLVDDTYVSGAEWELQVSTHDDGRFQLRQRATGSYLGADGTLAAAEADAAVITLAEATGCREHPELTVDAEGEVVAESFADGSVFGIVDTHSHLLTNFAFGGGGIFHGAPFHRLGVAHALPDCTQFHGEEGRKDLLGYGYDQGTEGNLNAEAVLPALVAGSLSEFNHNTEGWPVFTDWPAAPFSSTHQTQYYRWLERAYKGGLRLVVQHATSNSVLCDLMVGEGIQPVRYACNDMVAVDRTLTEVRNLERYIDAHEGGPGLGWFRIVTTPAEARAVIEDGKLAVILGIEVSNPFDCFLVPREGYPTCDAAWVASQLDRYHELGVRAIFPVHKYDNAFSAGDGHRTISELGSFANSGHWSSYTEDCPGVPAVFDKGSVAFGGLNMPRTDYAGPPPNDMTGFAEAPVDTLMGFLGLLLEPPLEGEYCQSHGLTPLGETLVHEMMARGMIVEVDHLPQRSYQRIFEILEENDYPMAATHGGQYDGLVYALGGVSKTNLGRCASADDPGAMAAELRDRVARITEMGGYPAQGFGFDLNGFAGAPGPRFGERSTCTTPQENPITYPFESYAGDVTFSEPRIGERTLDFNSEGLVHIGLLPELIEDARRTGVSDAELEPLFRSAEGYLRMWERAEARAAELR